MTRFIGFLKRIEPYVKNTFMGFVGLSMILVMWGSIFGFGTSFLL